MDVYESDYPVREVPSKEKREKRSRGEKRSREEKRDRRKSHELVMSLLVILLVWTVCLIGIMDCAWTWNC